ncbi:MAG: AI-2E family transporter [Erysipelotrichaceae bacterium]|nr:AI-2E family transporter [Erysipelotrichaceae bacterium]
MKKWLIILLFIIYLILLKLFSAILMPFLFAFLVYIIMKPLIDYFDSHALSISILAMIYLLFMGFMIFLIYILYEKIIQYHLLDLLLAIPYCNELITPIIQILSELPNLVLSIFIFIISTFLLVLDYKKIRYLLVRSMHYKYIRLFVYYKDQCHKSMITYIRCQGILMLICFIHVWIMFYILNIPHSLFYGLISTLLDALPLIGIGVILIPMAIYYMIQMCYLKGIYVLMMFIWLSFLRNIVETKMMNHQIQIPSFLLLFSMIAHIYFYGFVGIILSPIHLNILYHITRLDTPLNSDIIA